MMMEDNRYRERDMAAFNEAVEIMTAGVAEAPPAAVAAISRIVERESVALAGAFYREMMAVPGARAFLDHKLVSSRLEPGMGRWLKDLFKPRKGAELKEYLLKQTKIGLIHSRVNVPIAMVKRGELILKDNLHAIIEKEFAGDAGAMAGAMRVSDRMIELAVFFINISYIEQNLISEQAVQSFRQQAASRYTALDCERIKASVFDWIRGFFTQLYLRNVKGAADLIVPEQTDFGLWVRYKAGMLFPDHGEDVSVLRANVEEMSYLARRAAAELAKGGDSDALDAIVSRTNEIAVHMSFLLSSLVSELLEAEAGRDQLTQIYNRRYLPVILRNAVRTGMEDGERFAVAIIDIDHFKAVNDTYGHDRGDMVLTRLSEILVDGVRMGDSLFRYGGEEFLVVFLGVDRRSAVSAAEKLRRRIEEASISLGEGRTTKITVSIGVALHDGHPDYSRTISMADEALYRAKGSGRNRVVMADPPA